MKYGIILIKKEKTEQKIKMMGQIIMSQIQQVQISILYILSFWQSNTNRTLEKQSGYECGQEPMGDARMKFDIVYYVIGIQYQIFDLEIIFLFPQACIWYTQNNLFSFWIVQIFLTIQTIGFIYEWFEGALKL